MALKFNPIRDNTLAWLPKTYAMQGVMYYIISLVVCSVLFAAHAMPLYLWLFGIISIIMFFIGSYNLGKKWSRLTEKKFVQNIFTWGFVIRVLYVIFIYYLNFQLYDKHMEVVSSDAEFYKPCAFETAQLILTGRSDGSQMPATMNDFHITDIWRYWTQDMGLDPTECGYQLYLSLVYLFTGCISDFIIPLILKALWGTLTCMSIYRIAQRHFGENVARMTAIFCMLQMNMIWWCGSMMKETEMVFLGTLFVERMDNTIAGLNIRPTYIVVTILILFYLFTFRAALFMVATAATMLGLVMTRSHKLSMGKKVLAGIMIAAVMLLAMGDTVMSGVQSIVDTAQDKDYQKTNMEWRTTRKDSQGNVTGNQFAKYAGAAVFAPLIFTIPFPNLVYTFQDQEMQMQVSGGNFEKNILSFFIIFAMIQLLVSGQWRHHVFPMAYYLGYLIALVLSVFAQSGRFHMPILPFAMMFGAYGLTLVTSHKHKTWFMYALVAEVAICVFWSWFKLKGRGMI